MNILMSLMSLDIGGAETHVFELSKELKKRGHNIIITSNGGAYVADLEKEGIKHYVVPLQNKNPKNVAKAFSLLKKIIAEEKIDIVHSHARIPSFILGKIQKKMKFPFVTTAHWIFNTKFGLKYITDWGQKTLAVSEDIKKYLIDNYKLPESDITVTVNGIDVDKFSKESPKPEILKELELSDDDKIVVYVSRMDKSRSLVAHHLIKAAEKLENIIDGLKCVIVGGGDDFENVKKEADALNEKLGRKAICLTGARTDISDLIAPCNLFVGVSRAALEAMACEKPTIVAGNEGYIGLFDKDKLETGISTNFCCRGCKAPDETELIQDIANFFGLCDEEWDRLGKYSRNTVIENYSVKRMADDAEKVYAEVIQ